MEKQEGRSRVHKIVRVSHDIIISDTKNEGINIIRTGAVILESYVTRDECTSFYHVTFLPLMYVVTSSG